jgi:hypothetical protein
MWTAGPRRRGTTGFLRMEGREVFRHAVANLTEAIETALHGQWCSIEADDIDWFVPHQANQRILDATARKAGVHPSRVVSTVAGIMPIPRPLRCRLRLQQRSGDGRIKPGQPCAARGHGWRFYLGFSADPLVALRLYPPDIDGISCPTYASCLEFGAASWWRGGKRRQHECNLDPAGSCRGGLCAGRSVAERIR